MLDRLYLIYDAPSGPLAAALDSAKKLLGLDACPLCALTHGLVTERAAWRRCRAALAVPIELRHRDDLTLELAAAAGPLPSVVASSEGRLIHLLGPDEIRSCGQEPERLEQAIRATLASHALVAS